MSQTGRYHLQPRLALRVLGIAATLAVTSFSGNVLAQEAEKSGSGLKPSGTQWGLGIAAAVYQLPYEGADNEKRAIPLLYVENDWLRIAGLTADAKLGTLRGSYGLLSFTGRLKYEGNGYEAKDSPRLTGMGERKGSIWAGGTMTWDTSIARTSLEWIADVSGNSKGHQLQLLVDRRFSLGSISITPRVQAQWLDKKYVDYYYGVQVHEATASRARYEGKSAVTFGVGTRIDYQIYPRHNVYLDLSATRLPSEIKNSPIVGRSSVSRIAVGYLYRF